MEVQIVDYGMGNLKSVRRAVEETGARVVIIDEPEQLRADLKTILPGVGAYSDGMENLRKKGLDKALQIYASENGYLLGICLGMQMLASYGEENGYARGMSLIPGGVKKLSQCDDTMRIPHVGWNEVIHDGRCRLLDGIPSGADFYFVHSFYLEPDDVRNCIGVTPYGGQFCSVVNSGKIYGVQFHPEKSQKYGLQLIRNYLSL